MALTPETHALQPATTIAVGAGRVPCAAGWKPVKYGVSIFAEIANGASPPLAPAAFVVSVATDGAGANARVLARYEQYDLTANATNTFDEGLAPGAGDGGDFPFYLVSFDAATGNDVTASAVASCTASY